MYIFYNLPLSKLGFSIYTPMSEIFYCHKYLRQGNVYWFNIELGLIIDQVLTAVESK